MRNWILIMAITLGLASVTLHAEGSGSKNETSKKANLTGPLALDGKCAVCLVEMGKVMKGSDKFESQYDGHVYRFPEAKQKEMFDANPEKYAVALGGDCVVCLVEMGEYMQGIPSYSSVKDGMLFVFPSEKQKQMFDANPGKYTQAAIGADGKCVVCLAGGKDVSGSKEFSAYYDGIKYSFPSADVKAKFLKSPEKFVPAASGNCVVCDVEMGKKMRGSAKFATTHNGRLYLFPAEDQLKMFNANPTKYANADVALDGFCSVCLMDYDKVVEGKDEFTTVYHGELHKFPSEDARKMFLANPGKYVGKAVEDKLKSKQSSGGSGSK